MFHDKNRCVPARVVATRCLFIFLGLCGPCGELLRAQDEPPPFTPQTQRNQPGPWDNDVIVYRTDAGGKVEKLATFPRAGVPTLARLQDGRLVAAHQHFPANNELDFDKVAVRFSSDEGRAWSEPQVLRLTGLPDGMRFPFDPTLVPLPAGQVRLYFTSIRRLRFNADQPAIYSAVSTNGVDYAFEPGTRFGVENTPVIDCAVALHQDVFHLFAPDNTTGARQRDPGERPGEAVGYHATSKDGLNFTREGDIRLDGGRHWLGNVQSDEGVLRFFGTGSRGVWTATSANGQSWKAQEEFPAVPGADPGAVKLKDGGWLLAVTGPPREGRQRSGPGGNIPPLHAFMETLDANGDGTIDEWELENATKLLRKLDRNGDGRLTPEELRPRRGEPDRGPVEPRPRQPIQR